MIKIKHILLQFIYLHIFFTIYFHVTGTYLYNTDDTNTMTPRYLRFRIAMPWLLAKYKSLERK